MTRWAGIILLPTARPHAPQRLLKPTCTTKKWQGSPGGIGMLRCFINFSTRGVIASRGDAHLQINSDAST
ncbi:hypothetical protein E2C01_008997 [Portunus trituberculatus]|uniref:Uncharacterized protein n=1 Tax=Portunus trituberculatus TaxID=210409 RepID=A0A5B7D585_PORTR|nr:hypothetical protein [Portunus trituberculatus]